MTKNELLDQVTDLLDEWISQNKNENKNQKIAYAKQNIDIHEYINLFEVIISSQYAFGNFSIEFEKQFSDFLGIPYCSITNSGSSANLLSISALTSPLLKERALKEEDEIITVAAGFPTTVNPIIQNHLIPVFVDIDLESFNIQTKNLEEAITKKTKAIFLAHPLGNPFDLDSIIKIVHKYNLFLIEDCCDALGSKFADKMVGTHGHLATFSFYPAHHMTMGEGGAVVSKDPLIAKIVRSLRDWGRDCICNPGIDNTCQKRFNSQFGDLPFGYDHKYIYSHIGYNLKPTEFQAAIGLAQLKKLNSFISARKKNFQILFDFLQQYSEYLILPKIDKKADPAWFSFPITIRQKAPFTRSNIVKFLEDKMIMTRVFFGGNILKQPAYNNIRYRTIGDLINTDIVMNNSFFIGIHPLITEDNLEYMKSCFKLFFERF